jgi:hemoglobin-like flavoprotein
VTPDQQILVRESFAKVAPIAPQAAELFYGRLFELDPGLKPLFSGDMKAQGRLLMTMIGTAVANVSKLEAVVPAVRALGARHKGYGVQDSHYDTVAGALLWTLGQGLGDDFTPACRDAWVALYTVVAGQMKDAAAAA